MPNKTAELLENKRTCQLQNHYHIYLYAQLPRHLYIYVYTHWHTHEVEEKEEAFCSTVVVISSLWDISLYVRRGVALQNYNNNNFMIYLPTNNWCTSANGLHWFCAVTSGVGFAIRYPVPVVAILYIHTLIHNPIEQKDVRTKNKRPGRWLDRLWSRSRKHGRVHRHRLIYPSIHPTIHSSIHPFIYWVYL